jgi:hypothetical protein
MKFYLQCAFVAACIFASSVVHAEERHPCREECKRVDQYGQTLHQKGGFKTIDDVLYETDRVGQVQYQKGGFKDIDDVLRRVDRFGQVEYNRTGVALNEKRGR